MVNDIFQIAALSVTASLFIFFISPDNTLPGPTSTNDVAPSGDHIDVHFVSI